MTAPKSRSLVEMLLSLESCTRYGARFVTNAGQETFYPYKEVLRRAQNSAASLQAAGVRPGDRIAVILPTAIHFFDAYLGAQLAGAIPAALYPPFRLGRLDEYFARVRKMLNKIGARVMITDSRIKKLLGQAGEGVTSLEQVIDAKDLASGSGWKPLDVDPKQPAFLQFSSGTTVEPKAVMMSHENLLHNLVMMETALNRLSTKTDGSEAEQGAVCWLPLYHDMGLVGNFYMGLSYPANVTYLGPEQFIGFPAIWLQMLSRYKAIITAAPHFAYGLCATKVLDKDLQGVDLSNLLLALNGAEPIDTDGMNHFIERFSKYGFRPEAMVPVYGLAEAGLGVSFPDLGIPPIVTEFDRDAMSVQHRAVRGRGRSLPSVGKPLPGLTVQIWDPEHRALPAGNLGRIFVKGPSITQGYYNDPELTANILHDDWLDTGDLGFFFEENLYIGGRAKDLIIIRGRNFAPQEMEDLLYKLDGLRVGCAVAVSTVVEGEGEQLFILAEKDVRSTRPDEEIAAEIKNRILAGLSLTPYHIEILEQGTLPRTSSGKLRRNEAMRQFLAGELTPPEKVTTIKILKELGKSQLAWAKFSWQKRQSDPDAAASKINTR